MCVQICIAKVCKEFSCNAVLLLHVFSGSGISSLRSISLCWCIACNLSCAILCHESCPTFEPIYVFNVSGPAARNADSSCCLKSALIAWCYLSLASLNWQVDMSAWQWPWCVCLWISAVLAFKHGELQMRTSPKLPVFQRWERLEF